MLPRTPLSPETGKAEQQGFPVQRATTALLRAGERAPLFQLWSATGSRVTLAHMLDQGPVVLAFAGREPIAPKQLAAIAAHCSRISACGGGFLAVATRWPKAATSLASVTLLLDEGSEIAAAYGLPAAHSEVHRLGLQPTAATFVISPNARIILSLKHKNLVDHVATANAICSLQALARRSIPP